ncbi:MAG: hypothetical protein ACOX2K_06900 [Bacillota bacterium]|jgi:hypothetical protein
MSAAAAIMARRKRYISAFYNQGALSPQAAKTLTEVGQRDSVIFRGMAAQGIFVQVDGTDKYYLDQETLLQTTQRQRKVGAIALVFILIVTLLLLGLEKVL